MRAFTPRTVALIVVAAIVIEALVNLIDALPWSWLGSAYFLLVLFGPLATGVVFGYLRKPWLLAAATWALAGILSLITDWIFLNEDQVFHLAGGRSRRCTFWDVAAPSRDRASLGRMLCPSRA